MSRKRRRLPGGTDPCEPPRRRARSIVANGTGVTIVEDLPTGSAPGVLGRPGELLFTGQDRGDLLISEAGVCISEDGGRRPPTTWPEGRPVMRGGHWL